MGRSRVLVETFLTIILFMEVKCARLVFRLTPCILKAQIFIIETSELVVYNAFDKLFSLYRINVEIDIQTVLFWRRK